MSYDIFKQNMLAFMTNQPSITAKEQFAKKLVDEYDALIKRGVDSVNGITLQQGNVELMEQVLNGVLEVAFQQSSGEHAIITNMGKAFQAYWTPQVGFARQLEDIQGVKKTLLESAQELASQNGANILNDEPGSKKNADGSFTGYKLGKEMQQIKKELEKKDPPYKPKPTGKRVNEALPYENQPTKFVTCPTKDEIFLRDGKINYELQLSPNIKLKHLTLKAGGGYDLRRMNTLNAQYYEKRSKVKTGWVEIPEIVCNLKSLAVNIIEPLLEAYPGFMVPVEGKGFKRINSAYRNYNSARGESQHPLGQAIDVQWFPGGDWKGRNYSTEKYMEIANWCLQNLPVDQLIYEHESVYGRVWLHISHRKDGKQREYGPTTMYKGDYQSGFYNYYPSK